MASKTASLEAQTVYEAAKTGEFDLLVRSHALTEMGRNGMLALNRERGAVLSAEVVEVTFAHGWPSKRVVTLKVHRAKGDYVETLLGVGFAGMTESMGSL